jgi:hypothetical protein
MRCFQLLSHRVDGRGGRDWLAAAFAKDAAPHKVSRRGGEHTVCHGRFLVSPGTRTNNGTHSPPSWPGTTRDGGLRLEAQLLQPPESRRASVHLS